MHAKICIVSEVVCRVGEHQHGKSVDCRKKNSRSVCYIIYNKGQFPHVFIRVILLYVYLFVIVSRMSLPPVRTCISNSEYNSVVTGTCDPCPNVCVGGCSGTAFAAGDGGCNMGPLTVTVYCVAV